ncbi:MAG: ring-cleaving dioxygenase [Gemmatimonadales bacterium]|nr:MAG: ring-cleaving dioxygenase [Gemmatimonadales bacterium]
MLELKGFHHLTAVSADIGANLEFCTGVLGLRLVKRSVNQDDTSAYHLFYADEVGSPGTDLTFFDWPVDREARGTRSIVRTGLRVEDKASLEWWRGWLESHQVSAGPITHWHDRPALHFEDGEGQRLSLVADGGTGPEHRPFPDSPVPAEHQIRGLGPVVLSVPELEPTELILLRVMNLEKLDERDGAESPAGSGTRVHRYLMDGEGPHAELHVQVEPGLSPARPGAGGVHHVAFRTPNEEEYRGWADRLRRLGVPNSGPVDRYYFRSLYFREPGGILFEIATDGPGFHVDEPLDTLGESVVLPPFLEPRRSDIEARLKPLPPLPYLEE